MAFIGFMVGFPQAGQTSREISIKLPGGVYLPLQIQPFDVITIYTNFSVKKNTKHTHTHTHQKTSLWLSLSYRWQQMWWHRSVKKCVCLSLKRSRNSPFLPAEIEVMDIYICCNKEVSLRRINLAHFMCFYYLSSYSIIHQKFLRCPEEISQHFWLKIYLKNQKPKNGILELTLLQFLIFYAKKHINC